MPPSPEIAPAKLRARVGLRREDLSLLKALKPSGGLTFGLGQRRSTTRVGGARTTGACREQEGGAGRCWSTFFFRERGERSGKLKCEHELASWGETVVV